MSVEIYEEHLIWHFTRWVPGPPSSIVPNKATNEIERFLCPNCANEQDMPEHNVWEQCVTCDLEWMAQGSKLCLKLKEPA